MHNSLEVDTAARPYTLDPYVDDPYLYGYGRVQLDGDVETALRAQRPGLTLYRFSFL